VEPIKQFKSKVTFEQMMEFAKKELPHIDLKNQDFLTNVERISGGDNDLDDGRMKTGKTTARAIYFSLTGDVLANYEKDGKGKNIPNSLEHEADAIVRVARRWKSAALRGKSWNGAGEVLEQALSDKETGSIIESITLGPNRFAFYVNVNKTTPEQAAAYILKVRQLVKENLKKNFLEPKTGKLDMRFNPLAPDEDFFVDQAPGAEDAKVDPAQ